MTRGTVLYDVQIINIKHELIKKRRAGHKKWKLGKEKKTMNKKAPILPSRSAAKR